MMLHKSHGSITYFGRIKGEQAAGPERKHKERWNVCLLGAAVCLLTAVSVLFAGCG